MMRVDDLVTDLVIDVRRLALDVEILDALVPIWLANGALPSGSLSRLQVAVHEIYLLQAAKALADVLRTHVPHALDGL
ncbi:MAG: hypothetical protein QOE06_1921 [Thermoleophilaceae bacterium]|jgi:hypothetical protein|nr:hypothetical protein [Thermoleophilaceae bacterium]